jgi:hypothetical protein
MLAMAWRAGRLWIWKSAVSQEWRYDVSDCHEVGDPSYEATLQCRSDFTPSRTEVLSFLSDNLVAPN